MNGSALIIGASRGIGAELVRQYLEAGWQVHATVRDLGSPGELDPDAADLTLHRLDVRKPEQIAALATSLGGAGLDLTIHNAGIYQGHTREELMEVNASAPIRVVAALLGAAAIRPGGIVAVMTSQMGTRRGRSGSLGDYGDSKAALNDEFRRRAADWGHRGVVAVVIHPGWVRTDMGGAGASLSVTESVQGIRRLVAGLEEDHHGRFWTWDGREHPW